MFFSKTFAQIISNACNLLFHQCGRSTLLFFRNCDYLFFGGILGFGSILYVFHIQLRIKSFSSD
jgi:hypothetical protein